MPVATFLHLDLSNAYTKAKKADVFFLGNSPNKLFPPPSFIERWILFPVNILFWQDVRVHFCSFRSFTSSFCPRAACQRIRNFSCVQIFGSGGGKKAWPENCRRRIGRERVIGKVSRKKRKGKGTGRVKAKQECWKKETSCKNTVSIEEAKMLKVRKIKITALG